MPEDYQELLKLVKEQSLRLDIFQRQLELFQKQFELISYRPNPMAVVGAISEEINEVFMSNGGHLSITNKELNSLLQKGHDKLTITKIINVIFKKYSKHYGTLLYAVEQWLKVDPEFPEDENDFLLERELPPVNEQMRLFKGKAPKNKVFIEREEAQIDLRAQELQWRKEKEEEDKRKSAEQLEAEKEQRQKLIDEHLNSKKEIKPKRAKTK